MQLIQPSKVSILKCVINGMNFIDEDTRRTNFNVQEIRIYEDICKSYFTAELVIEAQSNSFEEYLKPATDVLISFATINPRNQTQVYTERFKLFSYESRPRDKEIVSSMVITISLIGAEYFKDRQVFITQNFSNQTATSIAQYIHNSFLSTNGGLSIGESSLGPMGTTLYPYQIVNQSPIKAIQEVLDKAVFARHRTCAPVYFRDKPGYKIGPLEYYVNNGKLNEFVFTHSPGQGSELSGLAAYTAVINFRPVVPKDDDPGGRRLFDASAFSASKSYFDLFKGAWKGPLLGAAKGLNLVNRSLDELRQKEVIDKNGPGGWAIAEANFAGSLRYSKKYYCCVPINSGINITCGMRIEVNVPVIVTNGNSRVEKKTLFVPRLIHELRFTEGGEKRTAVTAVGKTDIFCLEWEGILSGIA